VGRVGSFLGSGSWFDRLTTNGLELTTNGMESCPGFPAAPRMTPIWVVTGLGLGSWFDKLTTNGYWHE